MLNLLHVYIATTGDIEPSPGIHYYNRRYFHLLQVYNTTIGDILPSPGIHDQEIFNLLQVYIPTVGIGRLS